MLDTPASQPVTTASVAEARLRRALEADGYAEEAIQFVLAASRRKPRRQEPEIADDGWTQQLRSTAACAQTKL